MRYQTRQAESLQARYILRNFRLIRQKSKNCTSHRNRKPKQSHCQVQFVETKAVTNAFCAEPNTSDTWRKNTTNNSVVTSYGKIKVLQIEFNILPGIVDQCKTSKSKQPTFRRYFGGDC